MGPTHRDGPMAFVASLDDPVLEPDDRHHLARVLRVRDGEAMVLCDGAGSWRRAVFGPAIEVAGPIEATAVPSPVLTVAFSLIKGDRPEFVVQKLTELGVDRIVAFASDHSQVRWDAAREAKQLARFERIAREAAMQCRRTRLPVVESGGSFSAVVAGANPTSSRVYLADADAERLGPPHVRGHGEVVILIGPEGGWSEAERGCGLEAVGIADHVLRADTASVAAATLLTAFRSPEDD